MVLYSSFSWFVPCSIASWGTARSSAEPASAPVAFSPSWLSLLPLKLCDSRKSSCWAQSPMEWLLFLLYVWLQSVLRMECGASMANSPKAFFYPATLLLLGGCRSFSNPRGHPQTCYLLRSWGWTCSSYRVEKEALPDMAVDLWPRVHDFRRNCRLLWSCIS